MPLVVKKYADLMFAGAFYDGTERLWFSKSNWLYLRETPDGLQPLSGVTHTCHIIDRSQALMPWAVRKALGRVRELMLEHKRRDGFYELYEVELEKILDSARKADREILEDAGEVGHVAHDWVEQLVRTILEDNEARRLELLAKLPEDERAANACIAAVEWMVAHDVRWVATEQKVYSRKHGYAGTMDGLAYVSSCDDEMCCPHKFKDRLSVVDWKTSNYLYTEYLLQTASYWAAKIEETNDPVEDRWIIRLGKDDAEFDPWHAPGVEQFTQDFDAFLHALNLTRSLDSIEKRLSGVKEQRKAAMKLKAQAAKEAAHRIECPKAKDYKGVKKSKCFEDGTQCQACAKIYDEKQLAKKPKT